MTDWLSSPDHDLTGQRFEARRVPPVAGEPVCRVCYAATLSADDLARFNAEPVTSCVYVCPEHQAVQDRINDALADLMIVDATARGHMPPEWRP